MSDQPAPTLAEALASGQTITHTAHPFGPPPEPPPGDPPPPTSAEFEQARLSRDADFVRRLTSGDRFAQHEWDAVGRKVHAEVKARDSVAAAAAPQQGALSADTMEAHREACQVLNRHGVAGWQDAMTAALAAATGGRGMPTYATSERDDADATAFLHSLPPADLEALKRASGALGVHRHPGFIAALAHAQRTRPVNRKAR
ncbi:hypothetical protein [Zavarzinia sp. CC-PAN008]|uniref:hypothetical protein n=1 Tax=Zavarzinia sp. CC-PAN008 TaxID=3243332 RepID=UPI003F746D5C